MSNPLPRYEILIARLRTVHPDITFEDADHEEILEAIEHVSPELHAEAVNNGSPDFAEGMLIGLAHMMGGSNAN